MNDMEPKPGSWIVCPECGLKHSMRDDGYCPRCRAVTDGSPSPAEALAAAQVAEPLQGAAAEPAAPAPSPAEALADAGAAPAPRFSWREERSAGEGPSAVVDDGPTWMQQALGIVAGLVVGVLWAVLAVQLTTLAGYLFIPSVLLLGPLVAGAMRVVGARGPVVVLAGTVFVVASYVGASLVSLERRVETGKVAERLDANSGTLVIPVVWDLAAYGQVPDELGETLLAYHPALDSGEAFDRARNLAQPYADIARTRIEALPPSQLEGIAQRFVEAAHARTAFQDRLKSARTTPGLICGALTIFVLIRILWD